MKIKQTNPKIKAMVFAGCSFTWGQGLWYYSALDSLKEESPYGYNAALYNAVHHSFREKWRWPTRVADHFNTVGLTHYENGGANDQIVEYWKACFEHPQPVKVRSFHKTGNIDSRPISYSDVSCFVFQFTQWWRSSINLPVDGIDQLIDVQTCWDKNRKYNKIFYEFLKEKELATFHDEIMMRDVIQVKNFLQTLEKNNVKTFVLSWPYEHLNLIKQDKWLSDRFIKLNYNDKSYDCIEYLMQSEKLAIEHDYDFFDQPPIDGHPNLKCQEIIAKNVIDFIERKI